MTSFAINGHEKQESVFFAEVWFEGDTALLEGQGLCYNWDKGTDSAKDGRRSNRVEVPSITNAQYFAGVCADKHAARTGGQLIRIYLPGSWCNVLSKADSTIGVGRLTCEITGAVGTNGYFRYSGLEGEGSCIPMQTIDRGTDIGLCFCKLDGPGRPSGLLETLQVLNNATPLTTVMVGGTTLMIGVSLGSDRTYTLGDATRDGLRKKFGVIDTEITTASLVVAVTTGRVHDLSDSDLSNITFTYDNAINTSIVLEWDGAWGVISCSKTQPALS